MTESYKKIISDWEKFLADDNEPQNNQSPVVEDRARTIVQGWLDEHIDDWNGDDEDPYVTNDDIAELQNSLGVNSTDSGFVDPGSVNAILANFGMDYYIETLDSDSHVLCKGVIQD